jgi:hypothetical protein
VKTVITTTDFISNVKLNKETFKHENQGNHLISKTGLRKNVCRKIVFRKTETERNLKAVYKTAMTGSIPFLDVNTYDILLSVSLSVGIVRE